MNETLFIKQNRKKWLKIDKAIQASNQVEPERLIEYFLILTDDLSVARTYFPASKTYSYLNEMSSHLHQLIYKNKRERSGRMISFWKDELPLEIYKSRKELLYAFIIFGIAALIGAASHFLEPDFCRIILGDAYVNMTEANIESGDPMAVYKSSKEIDMFFGITINNIKVSLFAFAAGVLLSFGTGWILFSNGVMLGAFQAYFYSKGLLLTSVLSIWIHGTIEIASIVIAGAAGLTLGNSMLFPGSYSRLDSLREGARRGMKIVIGLVPLFVIAGFLESFITRRTEQPTLIRAAIIIASAAFIIYYFVYYPYKKHRDAEKLQSQD